MKTILLSQGKVALVDDADHKDLIRHKWSAGLAWRGHFYAHRGVPTECGGRTTVYMHRHIMQPPLGLEVDHVNGDGLDNRCANLRIVRHVTNSKNNHRRTSTRRGLPVGVRRNRCGKPFSAQIQLSGKNTHLGVFNTAQEAHAAYVAARAESILTAVKETP